KVDDIYLAVHDGGDKLFDHDTLKSGEDTKKLQVQKSNDLGSYLLINQERIPLKNVLENPEIPEQHTRGG
ncbi:9623_t:CDS:2, partial [Acaulospora morrowiae]